jgi:DNA-binding transcriptional LysR family regulator
VARKLNLSTSSVSRLVADLEGWLQTPLLRKTTRSLTLTDEGARYLPRCEAIVTAWEDLGNEAKAGTGTPRGMLHIAGAAVPMRKQIAPMLPRFLEKYPDVSVELHLADKPVDLVGDGIDLALRIGTLADSSMIARKCGEVRLKLTASPAFVSKHGTPETLDELPSFPCLADMTPREGRRWPVGRRIPVRGPVAANDGEIIRKMTLAGLGISLLPDFFVDDDIREGRLLSLFENEPGERIGIYILMPAREQITPAARAFADFVQRDMVGPNEQAAKAF